MAKVMFIDIETRSTCDLREAGAYIYAEDPCTSVLVVSAAFDDGPVESVFPHLTDDAGEDEEALWYRIEDHIAAGRTVVAHNAAFERIVLNSNPSVGLSRLDPRQMICTAVRAAAMGLPRNLEGACAALGLPHQKDKAGARLMRKMSVPKRGGGWHEDPNDLARLAEYCERDVEATRSLYKATFPLPKSEHRLYILDQIMNDRGFKVDRRLLEKLADMCTRRQHEAGQRIFELTDGEVAGVTDTHGLRRWLGVDSVAKAALVSMRDGLDPEAREVVDLRLEAGMSSVKKLAKLESFSGWDGRARGTLLFHGAATGRWSGRGPQPQNLPRGTIKDPTDYIPYILEGAEVARATLPPTIPLASSLLRSCIVASDHHVLVGCDLSQIEARVLAWLAGDSETVGLFRRGEDVYRHAAAALYRKSVEDVTMDERFRGKVTVLACGYQVGSRTFREQMKAMYGVEIGHEEATELVTGYRETHEEIVDYWNRINKVMIAAVEQPDLRWDAHGRVSAEMVGPHLRVTLPSGRKLTYCNPEVVTEATSWGFSKGVEYTGRPRGGFATGRIRMYGGRWTENIVQAVARDIMADAMGRLQDVGFRPILTVHDEIVCEIPRRNLDGFEYEDEGLIRAVENAMTQSPDWAPDLPIAAEGWAGERYRK